MIAHFPFFMLHPLHRSIIAPALFFCATPPAMLHHRHPLDALIFAHHSLFCTPHPISPYVFNHPELPQSLPYLANDQSHRIQHTVTGELTLKNQPLLPILRGLPSVFF